MVVNDRVLALDISSRSTGWAVFENRELKDYGVILISSKLSWAERLSLFRTALVQLVEKHSPNTIAIEDIYRGPSFITFKVLSMFHGVAYEVCKTVGKVLPKPYKVLTIRKALGEMGSVVCTTKEQAFLIMNETLSLNLKFSTGNDIADACAIVYAHYHHIGVKPRIKIKFSKVTYKKIAGAKRGKRSVQGTRAKKKSKSRSRKKSVQKTR